MTDNTVVHLGENSPEKVALDLMHMVFAREGYERADRKNILDTYAECLITVRGFRDYKS